MPLKKLDDMPEFKNMKQPPGAIKIDVENFEYFVLKGGEQLLRTYKPIVYAELWDTENRKNCFEMMKDIGYKIKILESSKLIDFDAAKHSKQNFFFVC